MHAVVQLRLNVDSGCDFELQARCQNSEAPRVADDELEAPRKQSRQCFGALAGVRVRRRVEGVQPNVFMRQQEGRGTVAAVKALHQSEAHKGPSEAIAFRPRGLRGIRFRRRSRLQAARRAFEAALPHLTSAALLSIRCSRGA